MSASTAPARPHDDRVLCSDMPGALAASACLPWMVAARLAPDERLAQWPVAAAIGAALLAAGWVLPTRPRAASRLALLAILGVLGIGTSIALASPMVTLVLLSLGATAMALVRRSARVIAGLPTGATSVGARGAALVGLSAWTYATLTGPAGIADRVAISGALSVSAVLLVVQTAQQGFRQRAMGTALALASQGTLATWAFKEGLAWGVVSSGVVMAVMALLLPATHAGDETEVWIDSMLGHPERLFVGTFAALCGIGALLLCLPIATRDGHSIDFVDALFTAVSAVCVTGLTVLDTPVVFSFSGQLLILVLIQLGGLGIMTFSTAAVRVFGGRMSLKHESAVASLISDRDRRQLYGSAQRVILFTFATELLGAVLLAIAFWIHGDTFLGGAWRGLFTSISAFCNAGFALQSDNLVGFQTDPFVLHVVATLIIVGGLSPAAVMAVPVLLRRAPTPVPLQVKLGLSASVVLMVVGTLMLAAFEWDHALTHLPWHHRLHNAWFQSITLRTAGFNSIDLTALQPATLTVMVIWMFIGGSPGGTAGGIKTTTAAILYLAVRSAISGRLAVTAFGRRVAERSLRKTMVVLTLATATAFTGLIAVQLTQKMSIELAIFEVVSALGTVGLTIGGTPRLDGVGKLIISLCMFVGRVGGLSMLMFLSHRKPTVKDGFLEQEVDVG